MAGAAITITFDDREVKKRLSGMVRAMDNPALGLAVIGEIGRTSIVGNFEAGGRPKKWDAAEAGGKTLVKQGFAGGLMGSITAVVDNDTVIIGTNKKYAAIHNFGGVIKPKKGRALKFEIGGKTVFCKSVTMPQREFMIIQDEDQAEMIEALGDFIVK